MKPTKQGGAMARRKVKSMYAVGILFPCKN